VSQIFALNRRGLNVALGLEAAALMLVPLLILVALDLERYWLTLAFGVLFVALVDPGGQYPIRAREMSIVAILGGLATLWGYGIGADPWGWVVLSAFVVVLLTSLAIRFGIHRFVAGILISVWFLVALTLPAAYAASKVHMQAWAQMVAWLIGGGLLIGLAGLVWLATGRKAQPTYVPMIPGDTTGMKLTRPLVLYALLRAIAVTATVAIAFGLQVPNADWMPIAALVAMKPTLEQSGLFAAQRTVGVVIGAVVAAIVLLAVGNKHVIEAIVIVLAVLPGTLRTASYTYYTASVAAIVLIAIDLPHPTDLASEGRRILFTFIGVGVAVLVTFLASFLQKHAKAAPQPS
jgi:hypothetical protein